MDRVKKCHYIHNVSKGNSKHWTVNANHYQKVVLFSCGMTHLPNRSSFMSLAACNPSSFRFFSICLLRSRAALSSAECPQPILRPTSLTNVTTAVLVHESKKNTLLSHLITRRYRGFRPPLLQSRQAKTDCSGFLPPHSGALYHNSKTRQNTSTLQDEFNRLHFTFTAETDDATSR